MKPITIVGGGLAGSEAAWQLADRGIPVRLYEMRPEIETGAHRTGNLGEIVCSNSFKSTLLETASGLLKAEMDVLGCRLLEVARSVAVPAGHALGIDRDLFCAAVTEALENHPNVTIVRECVETLDLPVPAIVATGPLTGAGLSAAMQEHCSSEHLYFYDAIAPSLDGDSIDPNVGFWASRYDKGGADYLNIPFDEEAYAILLEGIRSADYSRSHAFEEEKYFEACLPIEVLAARGDDTLRFGPMKPKGLVDPRTGREPYAAIQLRQESRKGSLLGMVGFQTRMTWPSQKELIRAMPGMSDVRVLRYGTIHRNIFLNIPELCEHYLHDRKKPGLYYAGQICGVEGYVESIMSGMIVALSIVAVSGDRPLPALPEATMIGALMEYVHTPNSNFQPMNANMGIMPFEGRRRRGARRERNRAIAERAIDEMTRWRHENASLFP
ncbi:MAG: methylenetetrahydrofolate--tRNA-(uracil(54)-C(5))-methyltransferase (FADH(2)-oxidizing) TrmFO [Candidatus Krumholzibacteriota bacterium]|nr:methylenetetrahydrofolate--tRNA-(uracil(54)-C(5))-methyltransferase (FADH(2)-oxidizing) TrmFO [Candidatus Krumholzibacteriota bacterium]